MQRKFLTKLTLAVSFGSLLLLGAGCGQKTITPPGNDAMSGGSATGSGNTINYPLSDNNYSEDNLSLNGTLDDSNGNTGYNGSGPTTGQLSNEMLQMHGRSSGALKAIYFNFDQANVQPQMIDILIENSDIINSIPGVVILEGNSDERGTAEYNLALGDRRATNTQKYLVKLGIDPQRIRHTSYGEERPLFSEQNEEAYRLNRRVDFIIR